MRIVCISDLHGLHLKWYRNIGAMPSGDVLVVSGDITISGRTEELQSFNDWASMLKRIYGYKAVIVIAGNHDKCLSENSPRAIQRDFLKDCVYLQDQEYVLDGVKFYGSPWTPKYGSWWFMKADEELEETWAHIPHDVNVLITHGPPKGILDLALGNVHAGSLSLAREIYYMKSLKLHVFGHIHEAYGIQADKGYENKITKCNASAVTLSLNPVNKPLVVEI